MELKRVLLNKKIFISVLFLLIISAGFYLNSQYDTMETKGLDFSKVTASYNEILNDLNGKSISQQQEEINSQFQYTSTFCELISYEKIKAERYNEYVELWANEELALRKKYPEIALDYDNNKSSIDQTTLFAKNEALSELTQQLEYIENYPDYLSEIDKKASQLNTISIFANDNSLSSKNICKTAEDYTPLKNIVLELGNDKPITSVMKFDLVHYLLLIVAFIVVFIFVEERKQGLQTIIYASPNGRYKLALKRCGILALSIILVNIITYAVMFLISFLLYGGISDLSRNVQSIEMFKNFVIPISEWIFILFFILINILAQIVVAFVIWFIISFIRNTTLALGTIGIVFTVEFLLYAFLPSQSNLAVLRYVNIFCYINPTEEIIKYGNVNAFVTVINLLWLIIVSALVLAFVFALLCLFAGANRYPYKTPNKFEITFDKILIKIKSLYWKIVEKLSITGMELYKLLVLQKGIIVIAAFIVVLFSMTATNEIYYNGADSIVNSFYENYSGKLSNEALQYIGELEDELDKADADFQKESENYSKGLISKEDYEMACLKNEALDSKRNALEILRNRVDYIEKNDSEVWLVNPNGYENLLGESGCIRQQNYAIVSIFCIIILFSGIFAFESRSNMYNTLMACSGGRSYLFRKKIYAVSIITGILFACCLVAELYDVCSQYSISNLDAPIKSLEFFSGLPFNFSIGLFVFLTYVLRFFMMLATAYIVCLVSTFLKYEVCMIASLAFLIIPSLLYRIGIEFFAYISISIPISLLQLIFDAKGYLFLIPVILIMIMGIFSLIIANCKWCRKGSGKYAT